MFNHMTIQRTAHTHKKSAPKQLSELTVKAHTYTCPMCGKRGLLRIRRRFIDLILSMFARQRRFRCTHFGYQWEGNLKEKNQSRSQLVPLG
jgi:hypothetical protein